MNTWVSFQSAEQPLLGQFSVSGNTPAALDEFVKQHPAAKNLLVPVERFAQTRKALETAGTAESILYNKIKNEL